LKSTSNALDVAIALRFFFLSRFDDFSGLDFLDDFDFCFPLLLRPDGVAVGKRVSGTSPHDLVADAPWFDTTVLEFFIEWLHLPPPSKEAQSVAGHGLLPSNSESDSKTDRGELFDDG
jgi:hypothetical protein